PSGVACTVQHVPPPARPGLDGGITPRRTCRPCMRRCELAGPARNDRDHCRVTARTAEGQEVRRTLTADSERFMAALECTAPVACVQQRHVYVQLDASVAPIVA